MKHLIKLKNVEETLLIPVWCRALETLNDNGIITDNYATRICDEVDFNFSILKNSWKSQVGVAIRTQIFDRKVSTFLKKYPDANIVILGAGLDARGFRLDNNLANWFHIDFKNVIDLRKVFFPDSKRHINMSSSILQKEWINEIPKNRKTLFIAEGLLVYFTKQEIKELFTNIIDNFENPEILAELICPIMAKKTKKHDSASKFNVTFKSGFWNSNELEKMHSKISFVEETFLIDLHKRRWKILSMLSLLPKKFKGVKIAHYKIKK